MPRPRQCPAWLSEDMARALAATCPPLTPADVEHAARRLMVPARATEIIGHLLQSGADLMRVRRVVEALRALRDLQPWAGDQPGGWRPTPQAPRRPRRRC